MALPDFSMRQLLEAGVHFGHQKHRWNPKKERYLFGVRNDIHILDLSQTVPMLHQALQLISDTVADGGRLLFVGTKRQAAEPVAEAAKRCAQYYMNNRWLGGTLTNWRTVSGSIARLRELEGLLESGGEGRVKKELLNLQREKDKLELSLGGIKSMGGIPDIMFVIDTNKEAIAIQEARKLNIPIIAILDTNSDPDGITYPVPGNDDAARAIQTYCDLIADAVLDGLAAGAASSGVDLGAAVNPDEPMLREAKAPKAKAEDAAPAGTEAVAEEMIAAAEPPAPEAAAETPPVADEAAKEATSDANDAVETEPAQV
jgi:small subunit ribosomal protein S2